MKQTQKTSQREIDQAKGNLADMRGREFMMNNNDTLFGRVSLQIVIPLD